MLRCMTKNLKYRLTTDVKIHGWSCKLGQNDLNELLAKVGLTGDIEDAAILPIPNSDLVLVKNIDIFTPIIDEPETEIQNIVVSSDIKKELNLTNIAKNPLLENVEYKPEQFPGLVYRMGDSNIILLIFCSGKIICTGAKKLEDASSAINTIEDKLKSIGIL